MGLALRAHQPPPSSTEQELVASVRRGDDPAFEELFSRYRSRISGYVMTAVGDHGRAEDITQEVFISALRRLRDTERPISFKPWIYAIAKNACIDEFRRTWRAAEVSLEQDGDAGPLEAQLPSFHPSPHAALENRQQLDDLQGAFRGLSESHHRILVLRELEGLSYGEIGRRMGMSRAMVESTLFRARKRLNAEFKDLESGRRCEHVRATIDRSELRSLRVLGIRERRQVERHLSHCHACRKHAWLAGFDATSLKRRGLAEKVAALLPIGWWRARRAAESGGTIGHARAHSLAAARLVPRLARYSEPAAQAPLGRVAAGAAALALAAAGGGYAVSSTGHKPTAKAGAPASMTGRTSAKLPTRAPIRSAASPRGASTASAVAHRPDRSASRVSHSSVANGGGAASSTTRPASSPSHPGGQRGSQTGAASPPSSVPGSRAGTTSSSGTQNILSSVLGGVLSKPQVPRLPGTRSGQSGGQKGQIPAGKPPSNLSQGSAGKTVQGAAQTVQGVAQAGDQALNTTAQTGGQVVKGVTGALSGPGH
jgi:RNA polymerase sigma factor (sigma-70 family)